MIDDNCISCMFSENTESTLFINDLTNSQHAKCNHINSAFYDELVGEDTTCRLYLNAAKYLKQQDRKEKLEELKNYGKKQ